MEKPPGSATVRNYYCIFLLIIVHFKDKVSRKLFPKRFHQHTVSLLMTPFNYMDFISGDLSLNLLIIPAKS